MSDEPGRTRTNADPALAFTPGTRVAGRYRILGLLGVGGMGVVYRALDEELGLEVALKTLRPEAASDPRLLERFRDELRLARQVTHRHVVRIHDLGEHEGHSFISMDLVPGRSLRELLEQEGPLAPERALALLRQLAEGLGEAHRKGVLHRDLKPANVLVDEEGTAFITDFGVARGLGASGLTLAGAVVGTPDYLSPEQARGEAVDARSDLFALGLLFFEMLSAQLPYPGATQAETLAQRISGRPRALREVGVDVPPRVQALLDRLLERAPRRRFQSAEELLGALDRPVRPWGRWLRAGALSLLALGGGFGGYAAWRRIRAQPPARALRVAVLPFTLEAVPADLAWMRTGLPDLVAQSLAESPGLGLVDGLRVRRTLEDLGLGAQELGLRERRQLAELLDADRLIQGRIRAFQGRLLVEAGATDREGAAAPPLHLEAAAEEAVSSFASRLVRALGPGLKVPSPAPAAPLPGAALRAYAEAMACLARGDSLHATPLLEAALREAPAFAAASSRLTEAYEAQGLHDRALEASARTVAMVGAAPGRAGLEARARHALLKGEAGLARDLYQELLGRYPHDVEARLALAEALSAAGDGGGAQAALQAVTERDPNHPRAWFLLAKAAIRAGDPRRAAEDYLVRALVIQTRLRNEQGQGDVLNAFGVAYQELGRLDLAASHYDKAAALRERIGERRGQAISLKNLATVRMIQGQVQEARTQLRRALAILEALGDRSGIAELHNAFGGLAEERGRAREALDHYRLALQARRGLGDDRALAQSHNNVGFAYYLLAEYEHAGVYLHEAEALYRKAGDAAGGLAVTLNLGLVQLAQGPWEAAVATFQRGLEAARDQDARSAMAMALGHLGLAARYQGRASAALAAFDKALDLLKGLEDARGQAEFGLMKAGALLDLGLAPEAEAALAEAAKAMGPETGPEQRAALALGRGEAALARTQPAEAQRQFGEALGLAEAAQAPVLRLQARLGLARCRSAGGDPTGALPMLRALPPEASRLGHLHSRLQVAAALAEAELARGELRAAEAALRPGLAALPDGPCGATPRLRLLQARILARRGNRAEAQAALQRARAALAAQREGLDPLHRGALDRSPVALALGTLTAAGREGGP